MRGRKASNEKMHTTAAPSSNAVAFESPGMPNARTPLYTHLVHSSSFPPRPLRTAPSRYPNKTRFGNRPPLIWMSVPAHNGVLVPNVVSMLLHRVISRARLYEVIRWSGLLRRAPPMRSKIRWCTAWGLEFEVVLLAKGPRAAASTYRRVSIASVFTIRLLKESGKS